MKLEDIKKVGVVGAGTMGFGITINFALCGYPTIMSDLNDGILKESLKNVKSAMKLFVEEELITQQQADACIKRINPTTDLSEVAANSDFVTETIIERSQDKRELFNKLDEMCPPHTIIVSNTSSLILSDFGSDARRQDKLAITHYFAPPHIVPGVEVVKGPGTSDETYNITFDLMKKIRKIPIRVLKELPGYLINRIQNALGREVYKLWAEGVATAEDIELGVKSTFGFRMPHQGPMGHYDLAGIWKWPADVQTATQFKNNSGESGYDAGTIEKIRGRIVQRKPWFVDPEKFKDAVEKRDREFVRRLKALYPAKET
ncbi:3-hydroxyacyl-CoA dehydrogenase family protein [Chloroflexota bacterium]